MAGLLHAILLLFVALQAAGPAAAQLTPNCAPGGNFDMRYWNLQLPTGNPSSPTTISSQRLQGCGGYSDAFFFTNPSTGALIMTVPGSPQSAGCVTTPNSKHCRTELREVSPTTGSPASWDPNAAANRLSATLVVEQADNSGSGTVVGQIHIDDSISSKPVCELYYNNQGVLQMGVGQTRAGGDQILTFIGNVPVGSTLSYEIRYERNVLSVAVNGGVFRTLSTYSLGAPRSYFKVGNYNQGDSPSRVRFLAIGVSHSTALPSPPPGTVGPPPGTPTIPTNAGIGPFNILSTLDHTLSIPSQPTPPVLVCDTEPADNGDNDDTVTLRLYSDAGCCTAVLQSIRLGTLDTCRTAPSGGFRSLREDVGANMFGRSIHVLAYRAAGCGGPAVDFKLSNADQCWADTGDVTGAFLSYKMAVSTAPPVDVDPDPDPTPPGCARGVANAPSSADVASFKLFNGGGCCTSIQDFNIGSLGACHNIGSGGATGVVQRVGASLVGKGNRLLLFSDANCASAVHVSLDLANDGDACHAPNLFFPTWRSFMISAPRPADVVPPNLFDCDGFVPPSAASNPSANTATLQLYQGGGCCTATQRYTIGTLDACHTPSRPFTGLAMAVGANLFGHNHQVHVFETADCQSSSFRVYDLTNAALCHAKTGAAGRSFRIAAGVPLPDWPPDLWQATGTCEYRNVPAPWDDLSINLDFYADDECCDRQTPGAPLLVLGSGVCYTPPTGAFRGMAMRVGNRLFGRQLTLTAHTDSRCQSDYFGVASLSNSRSCVHSGGPRFRSIMLRYRDGLEQLHGQQENLEHANQGGGGGGTEGPGQGGGGGGTEGPGQGH